jgi:hypothetical protein
MTTAIVTQLRSSQLITTKEVSDLELLAKSPKKFMGKLVSIYEGQVTDYLSACAPHTIDKVMEFSFAAFMELDGFSVIGSLQLLKRMQPLQQNHFVQYISRSRLVHAVGGELLEALSEAVKNGNSKVLPLDLINALQIEQLFAEKIENQLGTDQAKNARVIAKEIGGDLVSIRECTTGIFAYLGMIGANNIPKVEESIALFRQADSQLGLLQSKAQILTPATKIYKDCFPLLTIMSVTIETDLAEIQTARKQIQEEIKDLEKEKGDIYTKMEKEKREAYDKIDQWRASQPRLEFRIGAQMGFPI